MPATLAVVERAVASAVPPAGNDARERAATLPAARKSSAIVTARWPGKRCVEVPEMTEEEHRRVGDLADAMMQRFKREIAEKNRA
jgi:hypothetical protein